MRSGNNRYENDDYSPYAGPDYGQSKGHHRSDERIYDEVYETLKRSPDVDVTHIDLRVIEGTVYLEGQVPSREAKRIGEYLRENSPGVDEVKNELQVRRF